MEQITSAVQFLLKCLVCKYFCCSRWCGFLYQISNYFPLNLWMNFFQDAKVILKGLKYNSKKEILNFSLTLGQKEELTFSSNIMILQDLQKLRVLKIWIWRIFGIFRSFPCRFQVRLRGGLSDGNAGELGLNMAEFNMDFCNLKDEYTLRFFFRSAFAKLKKFSIITWTCPIRKVPRHSGSSGQALKISPWFQGLYQIQNFPVSGQSIPAFLLQGKNIIALIMLIGKTAAGYAGEILNVKIVFEIK